MHERIQPKARHRLAPLTLAALSGPSIPLSALSLPMVAFLPEYYSGELGLNLAVVGTVFMIVRLLDIAFDPLLGGIMDRTHTAMGRYRPWLMVAVPMIMLAMYQLFMAKPGTGPLHLTIWLLVAYAGWSIMALSQLALAANVSPDYHERSRIYGWWQVAFFIGMISAMLMPKIASLFGLSSPASGMRAMAWLVIALTPIMVFFAVAIVRERPIDPAMKGGGLREYFGLMRHPAVQRLLACEGLMGLASGATSTLAVFFFTRWLNLGRADVGLLLIGHFLLGLAFTPLWSWLANRIGKHRALGIATLAYAGVQSLFLFVPANNLLAALVIQSCAGLSYGATSALPRAMTADVADEQRLETGQERTGLLYALLIGVWKIGQALSVGIMFYVLSWIGFDPAPGVANPASALNGLAMLYVGLPILLSLLAAVVAFRYPLTAERHAAIRAELERMDAGTGL
jgi:Na+/melibiose symporter-like transporter